MKTKQFLLITGLAMAVAGSTVRANSLQNITITSLPDLVTVSGHSAPTPSAPIAEKSSAQSPAQLFAWLQTQASGAGTPAPVNSIILSGGSTSVGNLSSFVGDYLVVHWGNGDAGSKFFNPNPNGGFDQAFYITGADLSSITLALPSFSGYYHNGNSVKSGTLNVGGISFWQVYGSDVVPDGGTTVVLLGAALSALGLVRRKLS